MPSPFRAIPDIARVNANTRHTLLGALGIELTEIGDDFVRGRMPVDDRSCGMSGRIAPCQSKRCIQEATQLLRYETEHDE